MTRFCADEVRFLGSPGAFMKLSLWALAMMKLCLPMQHSAKRPPVSDQITSAGLKTAATISLELSGAALKLLGCAGCHLALTLLSMLSWSRRARGLFRCALLLAAKDLHSQAWCCYQHGSGWQDVCRSLQITAGWPKSNAHLHCCGDAYSPASQNQEHNLQHRTRAMQSAGSERMQKA